MLGVLLVSCEFFMSKEERTQRMVNQELLAIDWDDVDQYPLFENCDESSSKLMQKSCFQENMLHYLGAAFNDINYQVEEELQDTVNIDLLIDEHGFITLLNIEQPATILEQLPNFQEDVGDRLNDLTTVAPALKRGVPVSVRVRLPLILKTK